MKKLKFLLPYIFIILGILSIVIFIINRGFVHSDYQNYYKVSLTINSQSDDLWSKLSNTSGVIEVDRTSNVIYFQNIDQAKVSESLNTYVNEENSYTYFVEKIYPSTGRLVRVFQVFLSVVLVTLFFIGFSFVLKTRKFNWTLNNYIKVYGFYVFIVGFSSILLGGMISVLSLIYKVGDYSLISFILIPIVASVLIWLKLSSESNVDNIIEQKDSFLSDYKYLFLLSFTLLIFVGSGLGLKSIVPLGLLSITPMLLYFSNDVFTTLYALSLPKEDKVFKEPNKKIVEVTKNSKKKKREKKK